MKSIFVLLIMCLPGITIAQIHRAHTRPEPIWEYMIKGGLQYSSFVNSTHPASFGKGWNAGFALKIPVKRALWVQPEINYTRRKASLQYRQQGGAVANDVTHAFTHMTYSALLAYRPNDIIEYQVGPQFGTLLGYESHYADINQGYRLTAGDLNNWEYAVAAGIELNVSPLAFGARYTYGLREFARTTQGIEQLGDARLQGLQLYGALVF